MLIASLPVLLLLLLLLCSFSHRSMVIDRSPVLFSSIPSVTWDRATMDCRLETCQIRQERTLASPLHILESPAGRGGFRGARQDLRSTESTAGAAPRGPDHGAASARARGADRGRKPGPKWSEWGWWWWWPECDHERLYQAAAAADYFYYHRRLIWVCVSLIHTVRGYGWIHE